MPWERNRKENTKSDTGIQPESIAASDTGIQQESIAKNNVNRAIGCHIGDNITYELKLDPNLLAKSTEFRNMIQTELKKAINLDSISEDISNKIYGVMQAELVEVLADNFREFKSNLENHEEDERKWNEQLANQIAGTADSVKGIEKEVQTFSLDVKAEIGNIAKDIVELINSVKKRSSNEDMENALSLALDKQKKLYEENTQRCLGAINEIARLCQDANNMLGQIKKKSETLDSIQTAQGKNTEILDSIQTVQGKNTEILDSIQTSQGKNSETLDSIQTAQGKNTEILDSIKSAQGKNTEILDSIQTTQGKNTEILDSIQTTQGKNTEILDSIKSAQGKNTGILDSIQTTQGKNTEILDSIQTSQGKNSETLDSIKTSQDKNTETLNACKDALKEVINLINLQYESTKKFTETMKNPHVDINELQNGLDEVKATIASYGDKLLKEIRNNEANHQERYKELCANIVEVKQQLQEYRTLLESIKSWSNQNQRSIPNVNENNEAQLNSLIEGKKVLEETIKALEAEMNALEEEKKALEAQLNPVTHPCPYCGQKPKKPRTVGNLCEICGHAYQNFDQTASASEELNKKNEDLKKGIKAWREKHMAKLTPSFDGKLYITVNDSQNISRKGVLFVPQDSRANSIDSFAFDFNDRQCHLLAGETHEGRKLRLLLFPDNIAGVIEKGTLYNYPIGTYKPLE